MTSQILSANLFLKILAVAYALSGTAMAQCITPSADGEWWQGCSYMYVYIDPSVGSLPLGSGSSPTTQIQNAVNLWQADTYASPINISVQLVSPSLGGLTIKAGLLSSPYDYASSPVNSGAIATDTITINTDTQGAVYNASAAGYGTIFLKVLLHEIGHIFGLADWYPPGGHECASYGTIMQSNVPGPNDYCDVLPTYITSCDVDGVDIVYGQEYPDGCGGGGGDCECADDGLACPDCGGCCGDDCDELSGTCGGPTDPIIIDLTGRGYQLTNVTNGTSFDFYGKGEPSHMSWTAAGWNGGFLALDRNENGRIDNATELFSNLSPQPSGTGAAKNGFLALAVFDQPANGGNGDGWIDEKDAIFPKLLIWVDKNHNGISESDELLTLKQAGIQAISLKYSVSQWKDAYGNTFRYSSQIHTDTSVNHLVYDVLLQVAGKATATSPTTKP